MIGKLKYREVKSKLFLYSECSKSLALSFTYYYIKKWCNSESSISLTWRKQHLASMKPTLQISHIKDPQNEYVNMKVIHSIRNLPKDSPADLTIPTAWLPMLLHSSFSPRLIFFMNLCLSNTSEKNKGEKYVAETHNALQSAAVPH